MPSQYFEFPFGIDGNRTAVPDNTPGDGSVSYKDAWGANYEALQPGPPALDVDRQKMNQLGFDITDTLKEIQETGVLAYDARFNYALNAYTQGSDGVLYRAVIANGPVLVNALDPVGDTAETTWAPYAAAIREWDSSFTYAADSYVKASDGTVYRSTGTTTGVDPISVVGESMWFPITGDIRRYSATTVYPLATFIKGSDGNLYRADTKNGPGTAQDVVDPVGDATGTWFLLSQPSGSSIFTQVFTATGTYVPTSGARSAKVTVTGGGGGGGGLTPSNPSVFGAGVGGGAGGTGVKTFQLQDASYDVVVGAGGIGAAGPSGSGGLSSFVGVSLPIVSSPGGAGGSFSLAEFNASRGGVDGGVPTGGDLNLQGGGSGGVRVLDSNVVQTSIPGASFWGGGARVVRADSDSPGITATTFGSGGGGAATQTAASTQTGGDGGPGVVVIEEYF